MRIPGGVTAIVLSVTVWAGCFTAPAIPPTSNPGKAGGVGGEGSAVGLGMTTNLGATLVQDGEEREVVYWPRRTVAALQMIALAARYPVNERCDAGGQLGVGRTAIDARCGLGSAARAVSVSTGARWSWWHGFVGRTELQAGVKSKEFMAFVSTGLTYSAFGHKIPLDGIRLSEGSNLLSGPPDPSVVVRQKELAWSSAALLGFEAGGYRSPLLFMGFTYDLPFATTTPSFECVGCEEPHEFTDFDPGYRIGVMVGLAVPLE